MQQVSYGPLIMSIMSCYIGFFNVRREWQSLNTGPRFYLRLIQRTGWLWIYTSRTTDGCLFKSKKLSVPFLYPRVDPFQRTSASREEKPGAYSTPGAPSGRGVWRDTNESKGTVLSLLFYISVTEGSEYNSYPNVCMNN